MFFGVPLPRLSPTAPKSLNLYWTAYGNEILATALILAAGCGFFLIGIACGRSRLLIKDGFCLSCGYDIRASQGHCPECGTTVIRVAT